MGSTILYVALGIALGEWFWMRTIDNRGNYRHDHFYPLFTIVTIGMTLFTVGTFGRV